MKLVKELAGQHRSISYPSKNNVTSSAVWSVPRVHMCLTANLLRDLSSGKLCAWLKIWEQLPLDSKSFTLDRNKWNLKCAYSSAFAQVFFWTALLWWDRKTVECLTHPLRNTWEKHFLQSKKTKPLSFLEIYYSISTCRNNTRCPFHTKKNPKNKKKKKTAVKAKLPYEISQISLFFMFCIWLWQKENVCTVCSSFVIRSSQAVWLKRCCVALLQQVSSVFCVVDGDGRIRRKAASSIQCW